MKRFVFPSAVVMTALMCLPVTVRAGEAGSSASAGSNGFGSGSASADAYYHGDGPGMAKTKTRSGKVNFARGFAIGFDEDGLSLSVSHAVASRFGPAYAGTLSMNIGLDGSVSNSFGHALSLGSHRRSAQAGGFAGSTPRGSTAGASAGGSTGFGGRVFTRTWSRSRPRRW